ncbi:hypothetical protein AGMMS49942_09030 [Spirochaetia bacterium]|nr:hypothetical protein AGMMS49942_09030 [Spirochaetia bacterium]
MSANIKARREVLNISQEKLAELADISVQMINGIEGCRTWVSDKTLIKLAKVLQVEVFQLLLPVVAGGTTNNGLLVSALLGNLRQNIKSDIDNQFDRFVQTAVGS